MAGVEELGQVPSNPSGGAGMAAIPRRRSSVSSKRSARSGSSSTVFAGLPSHVEVNKEVKSYAEAQKAIKLFRSLNDGGDWTLAVDQHQRKIWMRKREGDGLPIVKGEAVVEGVTTEQVLGTILSDTARRECESPSSRLALKADCRLGRGFAFREQHHPLPRERLRSEQAPRVQQGHLPRPLVSSLSPSFRVAS